MHENWLIFDDGYRWVACKTPNLNEQWCSEILEAKQEQNMKAPQKYLNILVFMALSVDIN
jgi:hypothetical protein